MLGRDLLMEQGRPNHASSPDSMSEHDNELMGQATKCVRKFAPSGRKRMRRTDNGHITACKISDANPNEMIVSWSGDHIYSFDLVKSPDAEELEDNSASSLTKGKGRGTVKDLRDRKRKRRKDSSTLSAEGVGRSNSQSRHPRSRVNEEGGLALRVRYGNGQSEDISMESPALGLVDSAVQGPRESELDESQRRSLQIAKATMKIRKLVFSLECSSCTAPGPVRLEPEAHTATFTSVLGFAATSLPEMRSISRTWRYPVNPLAEDVVLQRTLRSNRDSSWRFVQAAGTLARVLGGRVQTASRTGGPAQLFFQQINPAPFEGSNPSSREIFNYDFLKAILLWLDGGAHAVLEGFKRPVDEQKNNPRFPIPDSAQLSGIDEYLIPYLLQLASERAIPNIDASRFERDEYRKSFENEAAAVIAFSNAVNTPFEDQTKSAMPVSSSSDPSAPLPTQEKRTALIFWGFKIGRGVLMNAAEEVHHQFVDRAFGGRGLIRPTEDEGRVQEDIDPDQMEDVIEEIGLVRQFTAPQNDVVGMVHEGEETQVPNTSSYVTLIEGSSAAQSALEGAMGLDEAGSDEEIILMEDLHNEIADHMIESGAQNRDSDDNEDDQDDDSHGDDDGEDITAEERHFIWQSASNRGKLRASVEANVPCFSHTRQYRGHCNIKTVKDVNFFGLQDEYVVSGSDSGHVFIWDKKTSQLLNILEGDGEVVNVVQGEKVCCQHLFLFIWPHTTLTLS